MEKKRITWLLMALVATVGFNGFVYAGNLEPQTTPGSTMKTLDEIPPTWSQILPASKRFVLVMNGEAILDKETGLVWEKSPDMTERTWYDAVAYCYNKTVGGRKGWRLPTIEELSSLVDISQKLPTLPGGHPFINILSSFYWSATPCVSSASSSTEDTGKAWVVNFGSGDIQPYGKYDNKIACRAWCVRGGRGLQ